MPLTPSGASGYAATYHEYGVGGWGSDTGFYDTDIRAGIGPGEGKTFAPIYVWADKSYPSQTMYFSLQPGGPPFPPANRRYILELLRVPEGVSGAPPIGTTWILPDHLFTVTLPVYATADGLTGYQFGFTITPTLPEPAALSLLATAGLLSRRRR